LSSVFRTPDDRFVGLEAFPFAPHYLELSGELDGLRMHHLDEGEGDPIVLLHGEPTWSYLYRKLVPRLASIGRVLAPDLIGFGRSDKVVDREWYTYERHVDSLVQFLDRSEILGATLVVQDWGGPIGLRAATVLRPERVARLVILNTGLFNPSRGPTPAWSMFKDFVEANPDLPIGMLIQGATTANLSDEVLRGYEAPFPNEASKAGAVAFPNLVPLSPEAPGAEAMLEAREALELWEKPTLVAFSDSDPIFPARSGERWAERIPGAVGFVPIEGASHFLQEDKGEEVAEAITRFLGAT
jgi:haloalkane dehalogenase